jgi:hypothetical protein
MKTKIGARFSKWISSGGTRKVSKPVPEQLPMKVEVSDVTLSTVQASRSTYADVQAQWRRRAKEASSKLVHLSYRWHEYANGMYIRKKTRKSLNADGTIRAIAVGKTLSVGRNEEKRDLTNRRRMLANRRNRQLAA